MMVVHSGTANPCRGPGFTGILILKKILELLLYLGGFSLFNTKKLETFGWFFGKVTGLVMFLKNGKLSEKYFSARLECSTFKIYVVLFL